MYVQYMYFIGTYSIHICGVLYTKMVDDERPIISELLRMRRCPRQNLGLTLLTEVDVNLKQEEVGFTQSLQLTVRNFKSDTGILANL